LQAPPRRGSRSRGCAPQGQLPATPSCGANEAPTISQTEGPYFTPNSPLRQSLMEPGIKGREVTVEGFVLTRGCKPVPKALVDFWQADGEGAYDNRGFRLRGHQFTDARGMFSLRTIYPGRYPGRTPHFHVKVQAPGGRVLTTQLYFPNEPGNARDFLFKKELLMKMSQGASGTIAACRFDFVLDMS
jgi:protocatechuate 3,4-dioxygenase beta subunit